MAELTDFRAEFNGSVRIEAREERLSSEPGALISREVLDRLGLLKWLESRLEDPRDPKKITHPLAELVATSILLIAQGWRDQDDADALRDDAVFRLAVSQRKGTSPLETRPRAEGVELDHNPAVPDGLASQPTLSRLGSFLSTKTNRATLRSALLEAASRRIRASRDGHRMRYLTLDIDSLPIEVHGNQTGAEYNGHYHARIFHPLLATVAETGDILDVRLREGNAHTAEGALEFVNALLDRVEKRLCQVAAVRFDAGFPEEKVLASLETRGTPYVARIKNNAALDRMAKPHLKRPAGRPPAEPRTWFYEKTYQASTWSRPRRVVLVVQERWNELFMHHCWLITNWTAEQMSGEALLDMYRERGTAEGHMGELMSVLDPALSSSPRPKTHYRGAELPESAPSDDSFAVNEVRLLLNALAYNVMHAARVLLEEATKEGWSLLRFRERVLRAAARVQVHARRATIVLGQASAAHWKALMTKLGALQFVET